MRLLVAVLLCVQCCHAQAARYVEALVKYGRLTEAQQLTAQYRRQAGDTPEALAAWSWVARGELLAGQTTKALADAEAVERSLKGSLGARKLDADPFSPVALGASIEVQAEALVALKRRSEALALLNTAQRDWGGTSIQSRLQKNILLLSLTGRPLPEIQGVANQWRGKPVLLFFWAHWCPDCKAEGPILAKLAREFAARNLVVVMPTRLYGYTAQNENAGADEERRFIDAVYAHYYAAVPNAGRPIDRANFERFGASTTPTLVLADWQGIVRLYHPGFLDEQTLRAAIEATIKPSEKP